jgi:opacity protein-like surface antigen
MRSTTIRVFVCAAIVFAVSVSSAHAQFGVGGRFAMIRGDVDADTSSVRFTGGQLRAGLSKRMSIELALDVHTETNEALTERVRDYPFQASLLLFPVRAGFSPFVLAGIGWYSTRVEQLADDEVLDSVTTRRRGYHAGFGAEIRLGRHAGLHGDYRYTFLNFGDDDDDDEDDEGGSVLGSVAGALNPVSRFLPGYEGSMWTVGLTVYF